jgi:hypothetical protein
VPLKRVSGCERVPIPRVCRVTASESVSSIVGEMIVGLLTLTTRYCVLTSSEGTVNEYAPVEEVSSLLPTCVNPAVYG